MALTIVACVAISFATAGAGTAAAGAMGLTGTAASVTAAAITGAVTAAATTAASGLIMTGKIDGKAVLKGALTGAISAAVTPFVGGGVVQQMAVQGTISKLSGGKFATGALSAAAAGLSGWVDTNVANALKGTALGGVAGAIGKAAGSITKAGVSSGGHGGEQFWNSIANDIGSAIVTPHLEAWAKDNQKTQPDRQQPAGGQNRPDQSGSPGQSSAPSPAPQVDPLEQASPPADLYGSHDQWASDNQQALEDDQRAQQRAQEEARSNAQSSFRQSEMEAQKPLQLTPPDLDTWNLGVSGLAGTLAGNVPVMRVGDYGSVEQMVKAHLGPNATRQEINRGVAQALEINRITNPRALQPNEILRMPDASTQAPTWGLQVRDRDNAIGQQIQAQREAQQARNSAASVTGSCRPDDTPVASDPFAAFPKPAAAPASAPSVAERLGLGSKRDEWNIPSLKDSLPSIAGNDNLSLSEKATLITQHLGEAAKEGLETTRDFLRDANIGTRAQGALQASAGLMATYQGAQMISLGIAGTPGTGGMSLGLTTVGTLSFATGVDQLSAGIGTILTGEQQPSLLATGLRTAIGLDPHTAEAVAGFTTLMPVAAEGYMLNQGTKALATANANAQAERMASAGAKPEYDLIMSGHGSYCSLDGMTKIPNGTSLDFYARHGAAISDRLGNEIELGKDLSKYYSVRFEAGESLPNYTLGPPNGLIIEGSPLTVKEHVLLSDLLTPDMGKVCWAACRSEFKSINDGHLYDIDGIKDEAGKYIKKYQ